MVSIYGSLQGFYIIIIWIIFEHTLWFDYPFVLCITIAYVLLFACKYKFYKINKKNNQKIKVKFKRIVKELQCAEKLLSVSQINMEGKHFYESNYNRDSLQRLIFHRASASDMDSSVLTKSNIQRKQAILKYSRNNFSKLDYLTSTLNLNKIEEDSETSESFIDESPSDSENQIVRSKHQLLNIRNTSSKINE